jgi:transcription initiation factor IIE alpha subunit
MPILRLTSNKTLPILLLALKRMSFTQTELATETKTSVGRVNKVIAWLKEKDIVFKEKSKYHISQPNRLCDIIAAEQSIVKQRSYLVQTNAKELIKQAKENKFVFCLNAAKTFFDKELSMEKEANLVHSKELEAYLDTLPRGEFSITLHNYNNISLDDSLPTTNIIRTIIDLKTIGEQASSEALAQTVWRTRQ